MLLFKKKKGGDNMEVEDIVKINNLLLEGHSLNSLDKNKVLGCSRRAFCNRAKKLGFIFSQKDKIFIKEDRISKEITVTKKTKKNTANNHKSVTKEMEKIAELEERLKLLEDLVLHSNSNVPQHDFKLAEELLNTKIVSRTFKVSKNALDAFLELSNNKLAMYTKQDLLSQALLDFAEKYK